MQHERRLRQSLEHPKLFYADSGSCSMQTQKAVFSASKDTYRENKSRLEGAWKECQRDRDKLLQALEQEGWF
jgi:hypothetical protein